MFTCNLVTCPRASVTAAVSICAVYAVVLGAECLNAGKVAVAEDHIIRSFPKSEHEFYIWCLYSEDIIFALV